MARTRIRTRTKQTICKSTGDKASRNNWRPRPLARARRPPEKLRSPIASSLEAGTVALREIRRYQKDQFD